MKTVYCDMDGVLANFVKGTEQIERGLLDHTPDYYWPIINRRGAQFWSELCWMPDGKKLWMSLMSMVHPTRLWLLTARSRHGAAKPGKWIWIYKNMGIWMVDRTIICYRKEKMRYATGGNILIDDRADTIAAWEDAGGRGIVHRSTKETLLQLDHLLRGGAK